MPWKLVLIADDKEPFTDQDAGLLRDFFESSGFEVQEDFLRIIDTASQKYKSFENVVNIVYSCNLITIEVNSYQRAYMSQVKSFLFDHIATPLMRYRLLYKIAKNLREELIGFERQGFRWER